jgi:outer membrane protein assembly factor BamD (BamD/ComL family)
MVPLLGLLLAACTGCSGLSWGMQMIKPTKPAVPEESADSLVLRTEGLVEDGKSPVPAEVKTKLETARELFRKEQYGKAGDFFDSIADNKKNPPGLIQEALYYKAECFRLDGRYPRAADCYVDLLNKFPHTTYREQAIQHMYDIANFWLNDTRKEMREEMERREGKRWMVWPDWIHFEKSKPLLDEEGRAIEKLEQVYLHDLNGPLSDQALFMCGTVKLYNENYREADYYFSQIPQRHPESKLAPKALELAILCKHMSTGGSDYDGRKTAEARKLVQVAFTSYPDLAREKGKFLDKQIQGIDLQQAEKDFKMAEFWKRTGHPGSAYWYYDLVRRRYPRTEYATKAAERMNELRDRLEKEHKPLPSPAVKAVAPPAQGKPPVQAIPAVLGPPTSTSGPPAGSPPLPTDTPGLLPTAGTH